MSNDPENPTGRDSDVSRREFLGTAGAALVVTAAITIYLPLRRVIRIDLSFRAL